MNEEVHNQNFRKVRYDNDDFFNDDNNNWTIFCTLSNVSLAL